MERSGVNSSFTVTATLIYVGWLKAQLTVVKQQFPYRRAALKKGSYPRGGYTLSEMLIYWRCLVYQTWR